MMKPRDLYAEIVEGFAALSDARDGDLHLLTLCVLVPGPEETGKKGCESERAYGTVDLKAEDVGQDDGAMG